MGKAKKATKKFVSKNLDKTLKKRNEKKAIQRRFEKREDKKRHQTNIESVMHKNDGSSDAAPTNKKASRIEMAQKSGKPKKSVENLDMDEFLNMDEKSAGEMFIDSDGSEVGSEDAATASGSNDGGDGDSAEEGLFESMDNDNDDDDDGIVGADLDDMDEDDFQKHKQELEDLKKKDPEFFAFLKKNDPRLVEFGNDIIGEDDDNNNDEDDDNDETGDANGNEDLSEDDNADAEESRQKSGTKKASKKELTTAMIDEWEAKITGKDISPQVLKKLLLAFRSACHVSDVDTDKSQNQLKHSYRIETGALYNKIIVCCLRSVPMAIYRMSGGSEADLEKSPVPLPKNMKGWKKSEIFAKSFLGNLLHLMSGFSSPSMILFTLRQLGSAIPLLCSFTLYTRKCMKLLLQWLSHTDEKVALRAYLCVRSLGVNAPSPFMVSVMKGVYMTAVRASKSLNYITLPRITFLTQCVVDLWGAELTTAYQLAFIYIRQCAIHLRNALMHPTHESFSTVYNWQFIQSLRIWTAVLSQYSDKDHPLRPLVFPLVQTISAAIRLVPTGRFFPLRFACVKMLNTLSRHTGFYIPVFPFLLEVAAHFTDSKVSKDGSGSMASSKIVDLTCLLRVSKTILRSRGYHDACLAEMLELCTEQYAILARSIAFPEMTFITLKSLKKFAKDTRSPAIKKKIGALIDKLEENSRLIVKKRDDANIAPKDVEQAHAFGDLLTENAELPIEKFYRQEKEKRDRERKALADAALQDDGQGMQDDDMFDSDDEEKDRKAAESKKNKGKDKAKNAKQEAKKHSKEAKQVIADEFDNGDGDEDYEMQDANDSEDDRVETFDVSKF
eukprot:ANDGO_01065.mRNA.1 Nucleolar complex protein 2 homolog